MGSGVIPGLKLPEPPGANWVPGSSRVASLGLHVVSAEDLFHRLSDVEQFVGLTVSADELQAAREPRRCPAAGQRDSRMTRQVEQLRQPQHEVAYRFLGC